MSNAQRKVLTVGRFIAVCGVLFSFTPINAAAHVETVHTLHENSSDESFDSAQTQYFVQSVEKSIKEKSLKEQSPHPSLSDLLDSIPPRQTAPKKPTSASVMRSGQDTEAREEQNIEAAETHEETVSLLLSLSERRVYVYQGDSITASYPVAVGRAGWETPTGEFEVFHRLVDPGWTNPITSEVMPPGPNNPLGDRWIAFWTDGTNSIGFHGTPNRESIGRAASHGCIRMYNEDVRELYSMVEVGTPVTVVQ